MTSSGGFFERFGLAMAGKRNPWGSPGGGGSGDGGGDGGEGDTPSGSGAGDSGGEAGGEGGGEPRGPRNPWLPGSGNDRGRRSANIEDIFRSRGGPRRGGGGGGRGTGFRLPHRPGGKSWLPVFMAGVAGVWVLATSVHFIQPREQGVVTWLGGAYSRTLNPGTELTLPWPIQTVEVENVGQIRRLTIGDGEENLILTGDQNLVNLSYSIRWNIKDLVQFTYQLAQPEETLSEVAESTMRAAIAETELDTVLSGEGREAAQTRVRERMQAILDAYDAGINVQGVEIARTEAPAEVIDAFNDVLAARQDRERSLNEARLYQQQQLAQAQGSAAEFNEIYTQYRLAPDVTRRRLYYETMESVLRNNDKTVVETGGVTPYLPLPEVQRRARANAAQGPTITVTPSPGQRAAQGGQ